MNDIARRLAAATVLTVICVAIFVGTFATGTIPAKATCYGKPMAVNAMCDEPTHTTPEDTRPRGYNEQLSQQRLTEITKEVVMGLLLSATAVGYLIVFSPEKVSAFFDLRKRT